MQKIRFIVNPVSGGKDKKQLVRKVLDLLDSQKFTPEVVWTDHAGHGTELARLADADIVVAVGGDGTVSEVGQGLAGTGKALGIIPCGSGDGLGRHLCLPLDPQKSLEIINNAQIESFDYGIINGMPFFCTCGMGFDAFISLKFAEAGKRGPITYVENVLKEGLKYKPETYVVEDESGTHRHKAFLIACANAAQYGNNAYIAPGASMKDGMMDVIIMEPFDVLDAPTIAYDMFSKTLNQNSKIKTFKAQRIHIHRNAPGAIHYDGDPIMTNADVDVELIPQGIRIVVNPNAIEDVSQPNPMLNAFSDFFNNISNVREDIVKGGRRIHVLNKLMLRRLSRL